MSCATESAEFPERGPEHQVDDGMPEEVAKDEVTEEVRCNVPQ